MARPTVLIVDDDQSILVALERGLRLGGFAVTTAAGGLAALDAITADPPDAVVLDVSMPDLDGVSVCARLREDGIDVPVCMLTARDELDDRLAGLRAGADDYLVKPFALEELRLRLVALLRRREPSAPGPDDLLTAGGLTVDPARRQVTLDGRPVDLTRREFDLLDALVRARGKVLGREQLLRGVWGYDFVTDTNVVDVFVGYLRRKLEADGRPRLIHTVRGVGFVLRP